jgi:hypothetical protein
MKSRLFLIKILDNRLLLRVFLVSSALFGFWLILRMDMYLPWRVRFSRAAWLTCIGHFPALVATLRWRGRWRFLVVTALIPSMVGIAILLWHVHLIVGITALVWLSWRMYRLLQGEKLED